MTCYPETSPCSLPGPEPAKGHLSLGPPAGAEEIGRGLLRPSAGPTTSCRPPLHNLTHNTGDLSSCPPSPPRRLRSPFSFFFLPFNRRRLLNPGRSRREREREREGRKDSVTKTPIASAAPLRPPPPAFRRASIGRARPLPSPFPRRDPARSSRAHCISLLLSLLLGLVSSRLILTDSCGGL
jgi:hypothetical protein